MAADADPDELARELMAAGRDLAASEPRTQAEHDAIDVAMRQFKHLVEVLGARGVLKPNDLRLLKKISSPGPRVQLSTVTDKHSVTGIDVDCESLVHLCKARCCSFKVILSEEDVVEGRLQWKLHEPYVLERRADGYCTHLDGDGGCTCYGARPATCRSYDCRGDRRVWLDFDARRPAPLPDWLQHARAATRHDPDARRPGDVADEPEA